MGSRELKLDEFKELYKRLQQLLPDWALFLVHKWLVWIENKYIDIPVKQTVDKAIAAYEAQEEQVTPVIPPPVYSETGSDFFDEMRLTAPWAAQEDPSDSP
jgi:hypothetical protein